MNVQSHFDNKADTYYEHCYGSQVLNCHVLNQQVRRKYFRQYISNSWICDRHLPALDIGCGPGSITRELKKYGFNPFSIDISYQMLINNRQNTGSVVKQSQCSADAICYKDNSFDVVTAAGVLEYVANDQRMLGEIMRVLKPGGMLIISVPTKFVISTSVRSTVGKYLFKMEIPDIYHRQYRPAAIRKLVKRAGFNIVESISHHFVFFPFDYLFPKASQQSDLTLTRWFRHNRWLAKFGKTYIISARKPGAAG